MTNILVYLLIGFLFYIVAYVKQEGIERIKYEWIRFILVVVLYPIILITALFYYLLKWED